MDTGLVESWSRVYNHIMSFEGTVLELFSSNFSNFSVWSFHDPGESPMSKRRRHWWKGPHLSTAAAWMLLTQLVSWVPVSWIRLVRIQTTGIANTIFLRESYDDRDVISGNGNFSIPRFSFYHPVINLGSRSKVHARWKSIGESMGKWENGKVKFVK